MIKLILYLSILPIAHSACPDGFDLVRDGECRGMYEAAVLTTDGRFGQTTIDECAKIQGLPVIIHNQEDESYWRNHAPYLALGLICNTNTKRWEWLDGTTVDYRPPDGTQNADLDNICTTGCTWWGYGKGEGVYEGDWKKYCDPPFSTVFNRTIYCTTQLEQPSPIESCEHFEDDNEDDICFQVGEEAETWQDAQMSCRKLGANLASIHNLQENSFVRRLAVSKGAVNGVFLGATISGKGGDMGWIDGTDWDFENFHPGFPHVGFGECLAMDTTTTAGEWMNIDCSAKLPVACIRKKITITEPNATCSSDLWEEGQIITSPGFPFSASMPCDFFLTVDSGKRVEVEIIFLEANSCCDSVLIYDGYLGAEVIANITGEVRNATYTTTTSNIMRVTWEPNGGVNVRGLMMTFRAV